MSRVSSSPAYEIEAPLTRCAPALTLLSWFASFLWTPGEKVDSLAEMETALPPRPGGVEDLSIVLVPYGESVVRHVAASVDQLPPEQRLDPARVFTIVSARMTQSLQRTRQVRAGMLTPFVELCPLFGRIDPFVFPMSPAPVPPELPLAPLFPLVKAV